MKFAELELLSYWGNSLENILFFDLPNSLITK